MNEVFDIAIIGAGPAGLTSAIYAARAEKKTIVFEKNTFGGQIVNAKDVENYPANLHASGFDLAKKMYDQAVELGAKFEFEEVKKISETENGEKEIITENETFRTKTIIIATGAKNRHLGLENEEEFTGHGVSYCATCDGAFYRGKIVAIQGGGDVAFEDALYLSNLAEKVYLIHRSESFRANEKLVERVKSLKNVELVLNSVVSELVSDDSKNLAKIRVKNNQTDEERELEVSGLFVAIGQIPETEIFSGTVKINDYGYIEASENCKTNISGVFVAGDCREKTVRQLVTATSDGAVSVLSAVKYLDDKYD